MSGGEITFRMNRKVWMITLIGEEGRDSGGGVRSVVIGELCERKE
jgi:hypothetical protein